MNIEIIDKDEAFWREVRELPDELKQKAHDLFVFKSMAQGLNRSIEDAIRLRIAGWTASLPNEPLDMNNVFAWQWRRPGPKGGRLFLSTGQAITALQKEVTTKLLTANHPSPHAKEL